MIITLKSGPHAGTKMLDIVAVAKGLIEPEDLRNGGNLRPEAAQRLISLIYSTPFLDRVTTTRMSSLIRDIDVLEMMSRQLVRVPEGTEPSDEELTQANGFGPQLKALPAQLFAKLTLSFLRDNQKNPNLQKEIEKAFTTTLANDIVDLAFNGEADDGAGATRGEKFLRLNEGWIKILRASPHSKKLVIDPATDGWVATLEGIKELQDKRARSMSVFLMSEADADRYGREINALVTGHETKTGDPARRFEGQEIVTHPLFPDGKVIYTPLKNLVYGLNTRIDRNRSYNQNRRALEYVYDMAFDFEVAAHPFAVLGE